jgi:hypothetical protein
MAHSSGSLNPPAVRLWNKIIALWYAGKAYSWPEVEWTLSWVIMAEN